MPKLIIKPGTPQAQEFDLKPGKNYVGRGFACDFKLEDASVSSSHAVIEVNGGVVTITDLGSTNGTRINGLPATGSPLQSGQMLKLGAVELLFVADATTSTAPPPVAPPPTAAAAQIATEFIIRDPSHVGVATAPPPVPAPTAPRVELKIPDAIAAAPPPPVPVVASTSPPPSPVVELKIPGVALVAPPEPPPIPVVASAPPAPVPIKAPPPPPPAPVMAAPIAPAPLPSVTESKAAASPPVPPPAPAMAAPPVTPAPISAAPAPPRASTTSVEAPPGKTMCKFHKDKPGQWLCQKCNELFCLLCVEAKPTSSGVGYFCRKCGAQCVPLKAKDNEKPEAKFQARLDNTTLLRTIGFGLAGAIVGASIWTGVAVFAGFDQPIVFAPLIGVACGYGVKIAGQDRPGIFFSVVATIATLLGTAVGKIAAVMFTHHEFVFTVSSLGLAVLGLALGMFLAWKVGGGDF